MKDRRSLTQTSSGFGWPSDATTTEMQVSKIYDFFPIWTIFQRTMVLFTDLFKTFQDLLYFFIGRYNITTSNSISPLMKHVI
jgi:hypothetical protein